MMRNVISTDYVNNHCKLHSIHSRLTCATAILTAAFNRRPLNSQ